MSRSEDRVDEMVRIIKDNLPTVNSIYVDSKKREEAERKIKYALEVIACVAGVN